MRDDTPLVSVIIPAYRCRDTIERAIRSVLAQSYPHWELLIVEDCSPDDTLELIQRIVGEIGDERITLFPGKKNLGLSGARNLGLDHARGDWFCFLDADDEYTPDRLDTMLAAVTGGVDIVCCRHEIVQMDNTRRIRGLDEPARLAPADAIAATLREERSQYAWDKLYRASAVGAVRFEPIKRTEDILYNIACMSQVREVRYLSEALNVYYVLADSLTWGQVTSIPETARLNPLLQAACGDFATTKVVADSLKVANTLAFLSVAHQGIVQLSTAGLTPHLRAAAAEINWGDIKVTARYRLPIAVAASALKLAPKLYGWFYRQYIKGRYGLQGSAG